MVLRTYDHNYQFEYYKPPPAHLNKKKNKKTKKTGSSNKKQTKKIHVKKPDYWPTEAPKLSQANENWLRRSDRARRFSFRAAANNPSKNGSQGVSAIEDSEPTNYGLNYMALNSFQYDPFGSTTMSDSEIKRNLTYKNHNNLDVIVDCMEVENEDYLHKGMNKDYWDEEEEEENNCFEVFVPIINWLAELTKICENAHHWIDETLTNAQNILFKKTVKGRLSSALLVKQAETNRKAEEDKLEQESPGIDKYKSEKEILDLSGPMGLALFSPFAFGNLKKMNHKIKDDVTTLDDEDSLSVCFSDTSNDAPSLCIPINLYQEDPSTVESYPHILNMEEMKALKPHLPPLVQLMKWERAYSVARDGDLFSTMLNKVECYKYTLLVIKTTKGEILGGFADGTWRDDARSKSKSYFGSGLSFVYHYDTKESNKDTKGIAETDSTGPCSHIEMEQETKEVEAVAKAQSSTQELKVYKWSGSNTYCQYCDVQKGKIAMGGGGSFGLTVGEWFSRGSTGRCNTFDNPPLSTEETFDVWEFEIYGFAPTAF